MVAAIIRISVGIPVVLLIATDLLTEMMDLRTQIQHNTRILLFLADFTVLRCHLLSVPDAQSFLCEGVELCSSHTTRLFDYNTELDPELRTDALFMNASGPFTRRMWIALKFI